MHGVVGVLERGGRLLLIQRSESIRAGGMWCFPGGEIEAGESPDVAIEREFGEEVGLRVEARHKLWSWLREDGLLHLEWWLVHGTEGEVIPNQAEVQSFAWLTVAEIRRQEDLLPNNLTFLDHFVADSAARNTS